MVRLPRFVVAAPASGQGKTTLTTGIIAALAAAGHRVQGFKVGPDFIDPGYHSLASGRPGRNLDPYLVGEERIAPLLVHGARDARISVIEGVMGLFDGQLGTAGFSSTAHVAALTDSPVLLTVDVSHAARTVGALVRGLIGFDDAVRVRGIILNKAASPRHADEVVAALEGSGVPILGIMPRDAAISAPSRHLGLVPVEERADAAASVARLADQVAQHLDLDAIIRLADDAPSLDAEPWRAEVAPPSQARPVVAVAGGRAFTFRYAETVEVLEAAGCRPVVFDPTSDESLPEGTAGLYLGGGFPEVHAADLAANTELRRKIHEAIASGLPTYAECAGMLYLCEEVDGRPMLGAIPAHAVMGPRLTLGYREATALVDSVVARAGDRLRGHEFHRTTTHPVGEDNPAFEWEHPQRGPVTDGFVVTTRSGPTLHASYLHTHWAGVPGQAQRFADAVHAYRENEVLEEIPRASSAIIGGAARDLARPETPDEYDLLHHGDLETAPGILDLAVNVRLSGPPTWLADEIMASLDQWGAYPNSHEAVAALAQWHGVSPAEVLPVAGVAEAFGLIARGLRFTEPAVVHPQFTEPEAALRQAGYAVTRVILPDFTLGSAPVPESADLVVVGNPTNPTGVLHRASDLRALRRSGRALVVDEAFMDAVPGEPETLLGGDLGGVLVLRSLTKTWGLAGLRVGYVIGDPVLIAALRTQQAPWAVSTPALRAIVATCSRQARADVEAWWPTLVADRAYLVARLRAVGLHVAGTPQASFVLARGPIGLRERLRELGFGVRRGDTFPGLDATWFRVRVPERAITDALAEAIQRALD